MLEIALLLSAILVGIAIINHASEGFLGKLSTIFLFLTTSAISLLYYITDNLAYIKAIIFLFGISAFLFFVVIGFIVWRRGGNV